MLRDVFYFGDKPNVHPREKFAKDLIDARNQCTTEHFWIINEFCDYRGFEWDFDFEFLPDEDVWAEFHNNVWPSQHQKDSGTWLCPKEHSDLIVYRGDVDPIKRKSTRDNWVIVQTIDESKFDFSWHPDPTDPPYIYKWGNKFFPVQFGSAIEYHVKNATDIKYMSTVVELSPTSDNWNTFDDIESFDYSWIPDPGSPPYIYAWGNQWNTPEDKISIQYTVKGATEYKYMDERVKRKPCMDNWQVPDNIDVSDFDFSWEPSPKEPAFIYQFGTQHQKTGGPRYIISGATDIKYVDVIKARALPSKENWELPDKIKIQEFDYSWHPDATEQPYTYQFGTQWQLTGGPKYVSPNSVGIKYIDPNTLHAKAAVDMSCWEVPEDIDRNKFDFSWHPHPDDPDYIYEFGTQHQKNGGPKYIPNVPDSEMLPTKHIDTRILKAIKLPTRKNWKIPDNVNVSRFDFSWHPDRTAPPYIYQFGTIEDPNDGPIYVPTDNNGTTVTVERVEIANLSDKDYPRYNIKTTLEDLVNEHVDEIFWATRENIDYTNFDFSWKPDIQQAQYIHAFGSSESETTQTYFVNAKLYLSGNTSINYVEDKKIDDSTLSDLFVKPDMFLVDRGNIETQKRYEQLKERFPNIQKTRFLNTWTDTINRCVNRSTTEICWILNSELDYSSFDFNYYPNPWQMKMVHVFGTQWSHWGTTFIVNRDSFTEDTKYIKTIEHLSNLNFVKDQSRRAKATSNLYDIFVVDYGNKEMLKTFRTIQSKANNKSVNSVEYKNNYLDTFKEILKQVADKKENYIWICSSICDYTKFDFTYICDPFAREQLHVFPSATQKYGDTFLVNITRLRELISSMKTLQDYEKINFNRHQTVTRYPAPEIISDDDTHTSSLDIRFDYPYVVLTTEDNKEIEKIEYEPINLWSKDTKNIVVTSAGATRIVVPKEVKDVVKREFYDYPHIVKNSRLAKSKPLDIVFLSNGEPGADENYEHLLTVTKGLDNRIVRVDGVNGRVAAYHAAAEASETPWMFTVFAKLKVSNKFDWNWQPDRLQVPKHYVFHAKNPVNNLVYGHQAMIAYNKKITLANTGRGLDFTQDDEHEVVELLSGVANFNTDEWTTWRTAFREAIKLCTFSDEISQERLKAWTTIANGDYAEYCLNGANDAVKYFDEVAGDFDLLKLSYDWAWLKLRFDSKYNL